MTDNSVSSSKTLYECFKYSGFSSFMTDNTQQAEWSSPIVMVARIFLLHCEDSVQIKLHNFKLPLPEQTLLIKNFCCSLLPVWLTGAGGEVERRKWGAEKLSSLVVSVLRPPRYHVLLEQNWILKARCPQRCPEVPCETPFIRLLLHSAMEDLKFSHYLSHIYFCPSKNLTHRPDDARKESSSPFFAPCSAALMPHGWGTILLLLWKKSLEHKIKSDLICSVMISERKMSIYTCSRKNVSLKLGWM